MSRAYTGRRAYAGVALSEADTLGQGRSRRSGRSSATTSRHEQRDRMIFGVPERFMRPRIILIVVTVLLTCFGMLMIYSASSIISLTSSDLGNDPAHYLKRQLFAAALGTVLAIIIARTDYHVFCHRLMKPILIVTIVLLLVVFLPSAGTDSYGATRWLSIGGFTFQPAEFAKLTIILVAANIAERYYDERSIDFPTFVKLLAVGVGAPLLLILLQPDKGTTVILGLTLLVMAYLAGMDRRWVFGVLVVAGVGVLAVSLFDDYSRERIITMFDPWEDPYGSGYQLIQGFYAFGSGGLFGVGIGMSRQKYSYLPMAYNDFIFAVIGEECGLVGTLGVLATFAAFAWAGYRIARYAPDMCGRLIASGCTSLIIIQLLVNVCGVLGMIPLTGKPVPFLSYGGSTIMSCLMIVGLIVSVSRYSELPETVHDRSRRSWQLAGDDTGGPGSGGRGDEDSFVGEPTPRSARRRDDLRVVDGGAARPPSTRRRSQRGASTGSRERIDLGPSAAERLRGRDSRRGSDNTRGDGRRGR